MACRWQLVLFAVSQLWSSSHPCKITSERPQRAIQFQHFYGLAINPTIDFQCSFHNGSNLCLNANRQNTAVVLFDAQPVAFRILFFTFHAVLARRRLSDGGSPAAIIFST